MEVGFKVCVLKGCLNISMRACFSGLFVCLESLKSDLTDNLLFAIGLGWDFIQIDTHPHKSTIRSEFLQ